MKPLRRKILKSILVMVVLSVFMVITGLVPIGLSFTKGTLGRYAEENLNADLEIHGPIRLRLGLNAYLEAAAVEVRKAGALDEVLAQVAVLSASLDLFALLRGDLHIKSIQIDGVKIDYCAALPSIGATGVSEESSPPTNRTTSIATDSVVVTGVEIDCADQSIEQSPNIVVDEIRGSAPTGQAVSLSANGRISSALFQIEAQGGNLNTMLESLDGFPLRVVATAEGASIVLTGEVDEFLGELEFNTQVDLSVKSARDFLGNLGIDIPDVGGLEVSAQARLNNESARVEKFKVRIGRNEIDGTANAGFDSERDHFEIDARAGHIDFSSFGLSSGQSNLTEDLTSIEFQALFDNLRKFDGHAHVVIDQLAGGEMRLDGVEVDVSLSDGLLDVSSSANYFMGGSFSAEAGLDLRSECEVFSAHARASGIDLKLLTELANYEIPLSGSLGEFEIRAESCGSTLMAHRNTTRVKAGVSKTSIHYQDVGAPIYLDELKLDAAWSQPSRVTMLGRFLDENVSINTKGGTIEGLVAGQSWPISVDMRGAGTVVSLDGQAAVGDSGFVDVRMQVDAPRIGALHRLMNINPTSELSLSASSAVRWSNDDISIDNICVSLGRSVLSGQIASVVEDHEVVLLANVRSAKLDAVELEDLLPPGDSKSDQSTSDFELTLPSVNLDLAIQQISGAQFEIRDIEIRGRARNQLIDGARMKMRIDDFLFEGTFDLDFRELPGTLSYHTTAANLDIGGILQDLDVVDGADIRAESLEIDYASGGSSLREIAVNGETRLEIHNVTWLLEGQDGTTDLDLYLDQIEMVSAPDQAIVWDTQGTLDGIPLAIRAETLPLGEILYGNKMTQFSVAASSGKNVGVLSGAVDWSNSDLVSAELVLSGQLMEPDTADLALLKPPLKGLTISTDLMISDREISATNLSAKLHESYATGHARVRQTDLGKELEIRLQAPHVQTRNLIALVNSFRDDQPDNLSSEASNDTEERDIVQVIREFVDAQTLNRQLDVQIGVDEVYAGDYFMGGAQIGLLADGDNFVLRPFTVSLPSGDIDVEYVVERVADGFESHLDMYVERLQYGDVIQLFDPDAPESMRGLLYLDTALTSSAPSVPELVNALKGKVDLLVIPEDIDAGVIDLWAANLVVALIAPTADNQSKKLNCMVAGFSVDKGVMKSKGVLLDSTDVIVRGKGEIDIANRTIDMVAAPQAKREKLFSMSTPIAVTGPWDDLQIGVGGAGFVGTLFRWYLTLIYVPYKWITGERFPADGLATCYGATDWEPE